MRGDTAWVGDAPTPNADAVITKACLHWGGINDKVALMPRRFAPHWLGLLEQYYDHTLHGYQNSEMFQKILAAKHGIPIEERRLPAVDYYHWLADEAGEMGCFPTNYVSNTCFEPDAWARVKRRICAKGRQA
ncbi:hypothetical protein M885DRAFT_431947 [Pelagophyceae sp. CCMP2097]|nr:hypothetical protein M885DRAFT_431947 [Pelagophyceae sp. CCMP2097]